MNYTNTDGSTNVNKVVKHVAYGLLGLMLFWGSFVVVGAGERGVVLNFGAVQDRVMQEGLNFKVPFYQKVQKVDVTIHKEQVNASAASKDLQTVTAQVALNYHLDPAKVNKIWQSVRDEYNVRIIDPTLQESVKAATAKHTAEELITKRESVRDEIKLLVRDKLAPYNIFVDEFNIVDFDFSRSFNEAIEAKVTAEQNALAARNKLEQAKYEAEQRIAQAKGEAEAIRIQAQAIQQQGGGAYIDLKAIEKWNGVLPQYMLRNTIPFINVGQ